MESTSCKVIIGLCGGYLMIGIGYTLSLLFHFPLWGALAITTMFIAMWGLLIIRSSLHTTCTPEKPLISTNVRALIICAAVTAAACIMVKAHGAYDAWLQWNSLAKYMASPDNFRYLRMSHSIWHADYPPGLPAPIAMIWRATGSYAEYIPRSISFLFYLAIPIVLCERAARVQRLPRLWIAVLAVFTINYECVSQGLNQYADVPLSLLLLLSFIVIDDYRKSEKKPLMIVLGFLLGGCMLMKNEGILLCICVLAVHINLWMRGKAFLHLMTGMLPPLLTLLLYKQYIPRSNDLLEQFSGNILSGLIDKERYRIIVRQAFRVLGGRFPVPVLFALWTLWKIRRNRGFWKSNVLLTLVLCFSGFILIYLTTNIGLVWLVPTTMNRLLMQLLPSAMYFLIRALHAVYPNAGQGADYAPLPSLP